MTPVPFRIQPLRWSVSKIKLEAYDTKRSIIFFSYDFRRNVNKRVVSWVSDGEKI